MMPFPTLAERSDTEIASRVISVEMDGRATSLPVLSVRRNREWVATFNATLTEYVGEMSDFTTVAALTQLASLSVDRMVDLLAAYDTEGVLGGPDGIADAMSPGEVYAAFRKVLSAAFPFVTDLGTLLPNLREAFLDTMAKGMRKASLTSMTDSPPTTGGRTRRSRKS